MDTQQSEQSLSLDIIIPIYNELDSIYELARRLQNVLNAIPELHWRILFINDGSTDGTLDAIRTLHVENQRFALIDLSRNFGHQAAITAGLACAEAEMVVLMDADLQDPPEVIPAMITAYLDGAEVVLGERKSRKETGIRRLGFDLFHRFFTWISDLPVKSNSGTFCLLGQAAFQSLAALQEKNRYIPGLRAWVGFKQEIVYYDRDKRFAGLPKQSLIKLGAYAFNAIFSFSYKPLRIILSIGLLCCIAGLSVAALFIIKRLLGLETAQTGFTTLITCLLFFGGAQLIGLGILGEYLARIYDEVKNRPLYLIREKKLPPLHSHQTQKEFTEKRI